MRHILFFIILLFAVPAVVLADQATITINTIAPLEHHFLAPEEQITLQINVTVQKYNTTKYTLAYFVEDELGTRITRKLTVHCSGQFTRCEYLLLLPITASSLFSKKVQHAVSSHYFVHIEGLNTEAKQQIAFSSALNTTTTAVALQTKQSVLTKQFVLTNQRDVPYQFATLQHTAGLEIGYFSRSQRISRLIPYLLFLFIIFSLPAILFLQKR